MNKTLLIAMSLFACLNITAQKIDTLLVEPGSKYIDGSFLKNYTNKWKVSFIDLQGKKTPNKVWTDYGEMVELGGKTYFHRVQDIYSPDLVHIDTWVNMVEKSTLKPWQFYSTNASGSNTFYQFSDTELVINSNKNEEKVQKSDTISLKKPVFDWNLYGMLLVGLPLEKEAIYKFPYYDANTKKLAYLVATIEGEEEVINANEKRIKTWKIKCSDGLVFWVTKAAPYVIQLELPVPERGKLFWNSY
ncbi:hypothetical protein [uncultured Psychroserpens sp.]|uniref:DUF3108 domain-containing protein n=1 Tax=uncultured Psychroserpens sp. TaxID=255436 RepID=UPI002612DDF4|nr:hypothetical protein [uncultured Psychroserpens sp.]